MKKEVLNKFFETMIALLSDAASFASKQVPELCNEIIRYHTAAAYFYLAVQVISLAGAVWLIKRGIKMFEDDSYSDACVPMIGLGATSALVLMGCVVVTVAELIKLSFAPRLFLLDYFKTLL